MVVPTVYLQWNWTQLGNGFNIKLDHVLVEGLVVWILAELAPLVGAHAVENLKVLGIGA